MASDPDPTESIREDVRKMKELCEKWEDAHPSSCPVQPAPSTDGESTDGESTDTSTPLSGVNKALRRKSLAQLDQRQILDTETVRIVRVESKYAEYLIVDSRDTVVAAIFGQEAGKWWFGARKTLGNFFSLLWVLAICITLVCLFGVLPSMAGWVVLPVGLPGLLNI
jgi:hypothetical protein